MSGRIAHRPNYRISRRFPHPPHVSQKEYLRTRWTYRQQCLQFEKHALGYGLSLIPFRNRFVRGLHHIVGA